MHKIRLSMNNYQLVAENAGQSPEVLMHHYNEVLDSEKRDLSRLVEQDLLTIAGTTQLQATSVDERKRLWRRNLQLVLQKYWFESDS